MRLIVTTVLVHSLLCCGCAGFRQKAKAYVNPTSSLDDPNADDATKPPEWNLPGYQNPYFWTN